MNEWKLRFQIIRIFILQNRGIRCNKHHNTVSLILYHSCYISSILEYNYIVLNLVSLKYTQNKSVTWETSLQSHQSIYFKTVPRSVSRLYLVLYQCSTWICITTGPGSVSRLDPDLYQNWTQISTKTGPRSVSRPDPDLYQDRTWIQMISFRHPCLIYPFV